MGLALIGVVEYVSRELGLVKLRVYVSVGLRQYLVESGPIELAEKVDAAEYPLEPELNETVAEVELELGGTSLCALESRS